MAEAQGEVELPLRVAVLELTNRCNLRCPHCGSDSGRPRAGELVLDEWRTVVDDLQALGCEEITLLGGEVFLSPHWLAVARRIRERGIRLSLVTNGLLVDPTVMGQLESLPLDLLGISLDGASGPSYRAVRGVDGFERVWALCRQVRDRGRMEANAITTFSRINQDELEPLAELLAGRGIHWQVQFASSGGQRFDDQAFLSAEAYGAMCWRLGEWMLAAGADNTICTMDDFGYFPIDPQHRLLHMEWHGCQAGLSSVGVRANGDVLGCLSLGDDFVEANLRRGGLRTIWRSRRSFRTFRERTAADLRGLCHDCPAASRCLAGCAAMAHSSTGSVNENTHCLRRLETEQLLRHLEI